MRPIDRRLHPTAIVGEVLARTMLCKYDELRLKTDTELIQVDRELDLALNSMLRAVDSIDRLGFPGRFYFQAERSCADACRLIPVIYDNAVERARLAARAEHLWKILDRIADIDCHQTPSENDVAAIARSLWYARGCPEGAADEDWFWAERVLQMQAQAASV
jgi:hypothetical protein